MPRKGAYYCTHCEARFRRADYDDPADALREARDCARSHGEQSEVRFDPALEEKRELVTDGGRHEWHGMGRCDECGDLVSQRYLVDGVCTGCRYRFDGGDGDRPLAADGGRK